MDLSLNLLSWFFFFFFFLEQLVLNFEFDLNLITLIQVLYYWNIG